VPPSPNENEINAHAKSCPRGEAFTEEGAIVLVFVNDLHLVENFIVDGGVWLGLELDRGSGSTCPLIECISILNAVVNRIHEGRGRITYNRTNKRH
jgi:hypothetical protein